MRSTLLAAMGLALAIPQAANAQSASDVVADETRSDADREMDAGRQPADVLEFSGIKKGDVVADFMAGGGYYTALLADLVGSTGMVYAINPSGFHQADAWEARLAAHKNIRTLVTEPKGMLLAPSSVDTIFSHLVFHDIYWESERFNFPRLDEKFVLANWYAAVRPGGTVIVADHNGPKGDTREITARLHRIHPDTVIAAMTDAGFQLVGRSDVLQRSNDDLNVLVFDETVRGKTDRFILNFQKPE